MGIATTPAPLAVSASAPSGFNRVLRWARRYANRVLAPAVAQLTRPRWASQSPRTSQRAAPTRRRSPMPPTLLLGAGAGADTPSPCTCLPCFCTHPAEAANDPDAGHATPPPRATRAQTPAALATPSRNPRPALRSTQTVDRVAGAGTGGDTTADAGTGAAQPLHARAGRMVISGRMADVCAELDRLAAQEEAA